MERPFPGGGRKGQEENPGQGTLLLPFCEISIMSNRHVGARGPNAGGRAFPPTRGPMQPLRNLLPRLIFALLAVLIPRPALAESLFYTIQAGSYARQADAEQTYTLLEGRLEESRRAFLRIERINDFFVVRVGRMEDAQAMHDLIQDVQAVVPDAMVVHGYLRKERIVRMDGAGEVQARPTVATIPPPQPAAEGWKMDTAPLAPAAEVQTLQVASHAGEAEALRQFDDLARRLPAEASQALRVERIGAFYAVRVGRGQGRAEMETLRRLSGGVLDQATILKAAIRPERIVRSLPEARTAPPSPPVPEAEPKQGDAPPSSGRVPPDSARPATAAPAVTVSPPVAKPSRPTPVSAESDRPRYSLQIATFARQEEAEAAYRKILPRLAPELVPTLRVEKISALYALRLGMSDTGPEMTALRGQLGDLVPRASVMRVYLKPERVVLQAAETAAAPVLSPDREQGREQPSVAQEKTNVKSEEVRPAAEERRPPAGADEPLGVEEKPRPAEPRIRPPRPQLKLDREAVEKMLISKYLDQNVQREERKTEENRKRTLQIAESANCLASGCHEGIGKGKTVHFPVRNARCAACHEQKEAEHPREGRPDFRLVRDAGELCLQCHPQETEGKKSRHDPYRTGDCGVCHDPHASEGSALLVTADAAVAEKICFTCHDRKGFLGKNPHGPVGMGACTFCHSPHDAAQPRLLRESGDAICFTCHSSFAEGLRVARYTHSAIRGGGCIQCHNPHVSEYENLLPERGDRFCYSCHDTMEQTFRKARTKHAGLFLEDQCATCHQAHYSEHQSLLLKEEYDLCLSCHTANTTIKSYAPKDIRTELATNEYIHGPVAAKKCAPCHEPHASEFGSLLREAYPDTIYAPFEPTQYALCMECHDAGLLTEKETRRATQFRNGSQNLHYRHASIERKGRTCKTCHKAHASDGPKLINRSGEDFGEWTMSLDFFATKAGGSCTPGCHREMSYDRDNPVNNTKKIEVGGKPFVDYQSK